MQHFNIIDENQTIYESLAYINNNFTSLLSCYAGTTKPKPDSNTPIPAGMCWYNSAENKVYQLGNKGVDDWVLVADLNGTSTTKQYVDLRIKEHDHDRRYLQIGDPAPDVVNVNGKPANTVIFQDNISDKVGEKSRTVAPSARLFEETRSEVRTFIDAIGDPDAVIERLKNLVELIEANTGSLAALTISNIQGLSDALEGKMSADKTLEQLGGVRADGTTKNGFTGQILYHRKNGDTKGGSIAVSREGGLPLRAVTVWDDGVNGTDKPDAVLLGDSSSRTLITAKSANDVFVMTSNEEEHVVWNSGNMAALEEVLKARSYLKVHDADGRYLKLTDKASDSSKLNGAIDSIAPTAGSIVKRNKDSDIVARYVRTAGGEGSSEQIGYFLAQKALGDGGDNYARPVSVATVKTALGISNLPNWSVSEFNSRFVKKAGDSVTGDLSVTGKFKSVNMETFALPPVKMGDDGVTDEYLVLARKHESGVTGATGISGHFLFQKGDTDVSAELSDVYVMLLNPKDARESLRLFDSWGTDIFLSIDEIKISGKSYFAAKLRKDGGAPDLLWQFHGAIFNKQNDKNIMKVVHSSSSNIQIVRQNRWEPAGQINKYNLHIEADKLYVRQDGTKSMTGDLKFLSNKSVIFTGIGAIKNGAGKQLFSNLIGGHTAVSASSNSSDVYLGHNSGSSHITRNVVLGSNMLNKANKKIIDAQTGQLFDAGQRVYSPANKAAIALKGQNETIDGVWTYNKDVKLNASTMFGAGGSKRNQMTAVWDVSGALGRFVMRPQASNGTQDANKEFGFNHALNGGSWFFDTDVYVGANKVWHAGNDGTRSGLDADLLDGLHASSFMRSDAANTMKGDVTFKGNTLNEKLMTQVGEGISVVRYIRALTVNKAKPLVIPDGNGNTLDTKSIYQIQISCPETSTPVSTLACIWNDGSWRVSNFNFGGKSSNYAWVAIIGGVPKLINAHANNYKYRLYITKLGGFSYGAKAGGAIFGANAAFSVEGGHVFFNSRTGETGRVKLWHQGNDGSGSGLDADLLDGKEASSFMQLSGNQKISGAKTFTGSIDLANNKPLRVDFTDNAGKYRDTGEIFKATPGNGGTLEIGTAKANISFFSKSHPTLKIGSATHKIWHSGNDGSGSGLDADLLDGMSSGSYMRADGWDKSPGMNADSQANMKVDFSYKNHAPHTGPLINMGVNGYQLQISSEYASNNISIRNRNGDTKKWGPWARVWTSLNDGNGSGLDADKLQGYKLHSSSYSKGSIPLRDGAGDITARLFRSNYQNESTMKGALAFRNSTSDNYIRYCSNPSAVRAWLGVYAKSEVLPKGGKAVDSDKVDGIHGGSLLRSDANDTFSGDLVSTSRSKGIFGIYDATKIDQIWSMGTKYRIHSGGANFGTLYGLAYKHTNNKTGGNLAGGHQMVWCENGAPKSAMGLNVWTSGNVTAYSDARVKTDLKVIDNALEKVSLINGYTFCRTDVESNTIALHNKENRFAGVVAQEVIEVLPEVVTGGPSEDDPDGHYSVAYGNLCALLIEAVKELKVEVEELKAKSANLVH